MSFDPVLYDFDQWDRSQSEDEADAEAEAAEMDPFLVFHASTPDGEELAKVTPWQEMEDERAEEAASAAWLRRVMERRAA